MEIMIIYPKNYDWILAGDVYIASLKEDPNQEIQTICVDETLKVVKDDPKQINSQKRITIIGHGSPGQYMRKTPNEFITMLRKLGLQSTYSGTIEFFTCDSALFNEKPVEHSLAHLTKNEFPNAKVIAAKGPSIYKDVNNRYVVDPDKTKEAIDIQNELILEIDDTSIPQGNIPIIEKGRRIRERESVKTFYEQLIEKLSANDLLIAGEIILD